MLHKVNLSNRFSCFNSDDKLISVFRGHSGDYSPKILPKSIHDDTSVPTVGIDRFPSETGLSYTSSIIPFPIDKTDINSSSSTFSQMNSHSHLVLSPIYLLTGSVGPDSPIDLNSGQNEINYYQISQIVFDN